MPGYRGSGLGTRPGYVRMSGLGPGCQGSVQTKPYTMSAPAFSRDYAKRIDFRRMKPNQRTRVEPNFRERLAGKVLDAISS